ncbi:MAG: TlpA family protein disulfide reductase [Gammaproteobacteria bacterium]|nr:TlpA family protein disulfide reductase [Gammaproteobacteria bacterium]
MRRLTAQLFLLLLAPLNVHALDAAPDFSLAGFDGPITLSAHRGKVVYLDFWASWCAPCRRSFPWMNQLQERYGDKGLAIIAVNLDKQRELTNDFLSATRPTFTIAFDPEGSSAEAYQVMGMPSSYLIDRNGKLHTRHLGFREQDKAALEQQIEGLLAQ